MNDSSANWPAKDSWCSGTQNRRVTRKQRWRVRRVARVIYSQAGHKTHLYNMNVVEFSAREIQAESSWLCHTEWLLIVSSGFPKSCANQSEQTKLSGSKQEITIYTERASGLTVSVTNRNSLLDRETIQQCSLEGTLVEALCCYNQQQVASQVTTVFK